MSQVSINNKKARYEYEILDKYTAGMALLGSEIKSIRQGKASIKEAYCFMENSELWIKNMNVSIYEEAGPNNHDPIRLRKLLLNAVELKKIEKKMRDVGLTIVPLKIFLSGGWAKIEIGIAKGKKHFDKRNDIRNQDIKRQTLRDQKGDD